MLQTNLVLVEKFTEEFCLFFRFCENAHDEEE
jgi:hypothetical protein